MFIYLPCDKPNTMTTDRFQKLYDHTVGRGCCGGGLEGVLEGGLVCPEAESSRVVWKEAKLLVVESSNQKCSFASHY